MAPGWRTREHCLPTIIERWLRLHRPNVVMHSFAGPSSYSINTDSTPTIRKWPLKLDLPYLGTRAVPLCTSCGRLTASTGRKESAARNVCESSMPVMTIRTKMSWKPSTDWLALSACPEYQCIVQRPTIDLPIPKQFSLYSTGLKRGSISVQRYPHLRFSALPPTSSLRVFTNRRRSPRTRSKTK